MSILITSPGLFWAVRASWMTRRSWLLLGALVLTLIPNLLYYGGGWLQYGYRYALDAIPVRDGPVLHRRSPSWGRLDLAPGDRVRRRGGCRRGLLGLPPVGPLPAQ